MKTMFAAFAVCAGLTVVAVAEEKEPAKSPHPDTTGWQTLFTGDLSDATFPKGVWSINKDGELTATKDEAIWTKKQYERFTLDLEFKTATNSNSGVFVYCTDTSAKGWIRNHVEIQILDDSGPKWAKVPATWHCGAIFGYLAPKKSTVKKPGEWNHMTVVCNGRNISVALNGEVIAEMDMTKWTSATNNPDGSKIPGWLTGKKSLAQRPTKGYIGLQGKHEGAAIFFRNVKIKTME